MNTLTYYTIMRESKDPKYLRLQTVMCAQEHGNKPSAKQFNTTVKTVRKWRKRYEENDYAGLESQSRRPKHSPGKYHRNVETIWHL